MENINNLLNDSKRMIRIRSSVWSRSEMLTPLETSSSEQDELELDDEQAAAQARELENHLQAHLRILHPASVAPQGRGVDQPGEPVKKNVSLLPWAPLFPP
ncbi:hypothetical protein [Dictyobacter kobayashii]|uniref:Uncharacterized protein n=1 Tax=Dictyobacter kobayashii TaxID=2014872 RepID=A0A402AYN6_9CHLR|nr:hypothetical protein [Dictyobacter kobayashii]GCE24188.1 hypothetical protein KDK_79880 [Dictyobacter kobayashii]